MKSKLVVAAKPNDRNWADYDHQQQPHQWNNHGGAAAVAVAAEFVADFVPPHVGIPIPAELPHEHRRARPAGNNRHVHLQYKGNEPRPDVRVLSSSSLTRLLSSRTF